MIMAKLQSAVSEINTQKYPRMKENTSCPQPFMWLSFKHWFWLPPYPSDIRNRSVKVLSNILKLRPLKFTRETCVDNMLVCVLVFVYVWLGVGVQIACRQLLLCHNINFNYFRSFDKSLSCILGTPWYGTVCSQVHIAVINIIYE